MQKQNTINEERTPARRGRKLILWLAGIVAVLFILVLVGWISETSAEAADANAYPPPGQMVDVGGYRLHIRCTGTGSPTVVIESGLGDFSATWGWVQPEVAKTTRVCSYDRAGMGWSEASPEPRTAREFAIELHTLLANANEPGPYVLVGHSLGGYTVRVYANDYPDEVIGVVLIDPQNLSVSGAAAPKPAPKPGANSLPSIMARIGLARLLKGPLGSVRDLPAGDKEAYTASAVTPRSAQTFLDELKGMSEGGAQARAVTTLGALPLIVLSRGKDMDAESAESQARYLQLSQDNLHLVADQSGHSIMIDQPEAAVAAIVKMVEKVRR